jgi:hypothetical protein
MTALPPPSILLKALKLRIELYGLKALNTSIFTTSTNSNITGRHTTATAIISDSNGPVEVVVEEEEVEVE